MADPSRPGWRRGAGRQLSSAGAGTGKGWQSRRSRAADSTVTSHRMKLTVLGLLFLALTVTFVVKVFLVPPATPLVLVGITGYPFPLPPNSFAQEDVERLQETNRENLLLVQPAGDASMERSRLLDYLKNAVGMAKAGGPDKDVVLIYLSAHGVLDGAGEPCLLPSDAQPADESSWLPMREVLEVFRARPEVRKVLLLDAGRIDDEWSLGVLYNGFTEQLEKLLAEAEVPRLYVLNSTSPGQRSLAAPELGGSVFGHFVSRGLQGEASPDNGRITLRELADYVSGQVSQYTGDSEQRIVQLPRLLTPVAENQDFSLAYTGGAAPAETLRGSPADRGALAERWKVIHEQWRRLQSAVEDRQLLRRDPLRIARLQQHLLRMERLLLAGKAYVPDLTALGDRVRVLLDEAASSDTAVAVDGFSLPLHRQLGRDPGGDDLAQLELGRWRAAGGKPPVKPEEPPPPPLPYAAAASAGWQFLIDHEPLQFVHLRDVVDMVDRAGGRRSPKKEPLPDVVEVLFLRMLVRHLDRPAGAGELTAAQQSALHVALAGRDLAEKAAAPSDERVQLAIQQQVNAGDSTRRLAEDRLFCDQGESSRDEPSGRAAAEYQQALARGNELAELLALRDTVWNGLPYLAAWVLRTPDPATGRGLAVSVDQLVKDVEALARRNHELAALLDQPAADGQAEARSRLQSVAGEVRQAWQELRDSYVGYCQELKDRASRDKPTLREIAGVLRVPSPLLDAEERGLLMSAIVNQMFEPVDLPASRAAGAPLGSPGDSGGIPRLLLPFAREPARLHPVVQMLDRAQFALLLNRHKSPEERPRGAESDVAWLARQGERVRQLLSDLDQAARDLEDDTKDRLKDAVETAANIRAGVSEADRLLRAAAAVATGDLRDSPRRLRDLDRHQQLLWHARRALDDFWGPIPGPEGRGDSYFDLVATRYLDAARQFDDTPTSLMYERKDLRQLLDERRAAAAALRLEPADVRTIGDTPTVTQHTRIVWAKDLPVPGTSALYFDARRPGGELELVPVQDSDARRWRRRPFDVAVSGEARSIQQIAGRDLEGSRSSQSLAANLFYRGHVLRRTFELQGPELILVQSVSPQLPPAAQVTVRGAANRKAFITFILDCSGSMRAADIGGLKRMDAAKTALFDVLQRLPLQENYHVGLRAYAHRYRFKDTTLQQVVDRDGRPASANPGPDRDVETLVGIQQLNQQHLELIREKARDLRENGVTPLYFAIKTALLDAERDFFFATKSDLQHIIVITDGVNDNYVHLTSAKEVLDIIDEQQTRGAARRVVDVILLQGTAGQNALPGADVQGGLQEIKQIAERTGGHYYSATSSAQLAGAIDKALGQFRFSVAPFDQPDVAASDLVALGRTKMVNFPPARPGRFRVRLQGAENAAEQIVELKGGEALELEYDRAGNRLVFPPYRTLQSRNDRDPLDPQSRDRFRVIPILPEKSLNRVEFRVAIQNTDPAKFTPRPEHVWAEITPLDGGGMPVRPADVFYDTQFVPGLPVPVLTFTVHDWPATAPQASLRMWFKFAGLQLTPNGQQAITSLQPTTIPEDIPQAAFTALIRQLGDGRTGWRVTVTERHDPGTELFTTRVQCLPTADRISHRFYVGLGEARHDFDYDATPAPTVVITSRDKVMQSAVEVPSVILQVKE